MFLLSGCCQVCGRSTCTYQKLGAEWNAVEHLKLWPKDGGTPPTQTQERSLYPWGPVPVMVGNDVHLTGDGYSTIRVLDPQPEDVVHVRLVWDTAKCSPGTKIGPSIRRADSPESISVVYDHDAETLELFHGSTSLHLLSGTFSGQMDVKIELPTVLELTTDINVYVDEVLTYTEPAFAFKFPEELSLGIVFEAGTSGELRWDEIHISPCPYCSPPPLPNCQDYDFPRYWKTTIGSFGDQNPERPQEECNCADGTPLTEEPCALVAGTHYIANLGWTQGYHYGESKWVPALKTDPPLCRWSSVLIAGDNPWSDQAGSGTAGRLPLKIMGYMPQLDRQNPSSFVWYVNCNGELWNPSIATNTPYTSADTVVDMIGATPDTPGNAKWSLYVNIRGHGVWTPTPGVPWTPDTFGDAVCNWAQYHYQTADLPSNFDYLTQNLVFNLASGVSGRDRCTSPPAAITLVPDTVAADDEASDRFAALLAACDESCEPPVEIVSNTCYMTELNFVDENGWTWRYSVPMGLWWDDAEGSWEWRGFPVGYDNYIHDTCGPLPRLGVRVYCGRDAEGDAKSWRMEIKNLDTEETSTFPLTWFETEDPEVQIPEFEGVTTIMCSGETWDFYAFGLSPVLEDAFELGGCTWSACASPTGAMFGAAITVECDGGLGYTQRWGYMLFRQSDMLPVGINSGDVDGMTFWAQMPSGLNDGDISLACVLVHNGNAMVYLTDANREIVADGFATISMSCDPSTGFPDLGDTSPISYLWGFPSPVTTDPFGICGGSTGYGSWNIEFW